MVPSSSIIDVAQRAGVSTATVSRAIRGLPRVSDSTRARVMRAAAELGYVISPQASSLASGRTNSVGVVVPFVNKWFFGQVVAGIDAVLRQRLRIAALQPGRRARSSTVLRAHAGAAAGGRADRPGAAAVQD